MEVQRHGWIARNRAEDWAVELERTAAKRAQTRRWIGAEGVLFLVLAGRTSIGHERGIGCWLWLKHPPRLRARRLDDFWALRL